MPYVFHGARRGYGVRRYSHNPLVGRSGRPLAGAALKAAQRSVAKGRIPRGVRYVADAGSVRMGRPIRSLKKRIKKARRLGAAKSVKRSLRSMAARRAAKTRKRKAVARRRAALKGARKRRKKSMAKSTKRRGKRRGARRAARRGRPKSHHRKRRVHGRRRRKGLKIRRTKIRATVASVKRGRRKAKLVFLVRKGRVSKRVRSRLRRAKVSFNPMTTGRTGFMASLKSLFSVETVKVVGGSLLGFSISAAVGEGVVRKFLPTQSKGVQVGVGLGVGLVAAAAGGALVSRLSPTLGKAFFWGGVLGTVIRALAALFPAKGFDMPKTAAEADTLAVKLHSLEAGSGAALAQQTAINQGLPAAVRALIPAAAGGTADWLQAGSQDWANVRGSEDWLPLAGGGNHPALSAGGGQHW